MRIAFFLFSLFLVAFSAHSSSEKKYFALSSSGGISLGNFQAGRLFYQNITLISNGLPYIPSVFTGASAGSINAVLSLMTICRNETTSPNESLYWETWLPVGFNKLVPKDEVTYISLFSNKTFVHIAEGIKKEWMKGFGTGCVAYLGIPITLKDPEVIQLNSSLSVQRQLVTVVLKVTGRGKNKPPLIENVPNPDATVSSPRLYLDKDPLLQFNALIDVLLASAAFPGAFPPQKVRMCFYPGNGCEKDKSEVREFIDGGIFENKPIKLALQVSKRIQEKKLKPILYLHVDTTARGYPFEKQATESAKKSFLRTVLNTGTTFIETSRSQELYSFIQEYYDLKDKIISTVSQFPRASDPWAAFMGFFDKGFREFDFLLGMYEAQKEKEKMKDPLLQKTALITVRDEDVEIEGSWRRYQCLVQYLEGIPEEKRDLICSSAAMKNLLILSQVSVWRLYSSCHSEKIRKEEWVGCGVLKRWEGVPVLSNQFRENVILPAKNEDSGEYLISALGSLDYEFDKEEFDKKDSIDYQLRSKVQVLLDRVAEKQPEEERKALKHLGTSSLNFYRYLAPQNSLYLTLGPLSEVGWISRSVPGFRENSNLSFNLALELENAEALFETRENFTLSPLVGVVYPLRTISDARVQYHLGAGLGYIFSGQDISNDATCDEEITLCRGTLLRASFGISFMDLFLINLYQRFSSKALDTDLAVGFKFNY